MVGCVSEMSEKVYFSAGQVLEGKVDVMALKSRFVFIRSDMGGFSRLAKALEYMTKFGWRVLGGYGNTIVMLEKEA